jgi:putative hydrolase of the HAD superfamily
MAMLTVIAFDADDTLWHNEQFFQWTQERFQSLLAPYAEPANLPVRLLEAEKRNLALYGYGVKGFTLSMIETAIEVTSGAVPASVIAAILDAGREMLSHPVDCLPHVRETLATLSASHRLLLITKGDLFDQERKVAQSGLGDFFSAVEIVSEKNAPTYQRLFDRHGIQAASAMMVGNSLKSDILPALATGAWGVHAPHRLTWALEAADPPVGHPRFRVIEHMGVLPALLPTLEQTPSDPASITPDTPSRSGS